MCFPERIRRLPPFAGAFRARSLDADGCQVLFACYEAGQRIPAHRHDTENVGVVTGGELRLTVAGVERAYRTGEWYQIPAHAPHAARFDQQTAIVEFWFTD
jgi:quercetin dioxygenase-like cupin family protein